MAADIGADMGRADLALRELDGGEHRPLRAAGAEIRRSRRDIADGGGDGGLVREQRIGLRGNGIGIDAGRARLRQERGNPAQPDFRRVVAATRQAALAEHAR